jgi:hypothetical protein
MVGREVGTMVVVVVVVVARLRVLFTWGVQAELLLCLALLLPILLVVRVVEEQVLRATTLVARILVLVGLVGMVGVLCQVGTRHPKEVETVALV